MFAKGTWQRIGTIGVDAGLCWVGDPCYCITPDASSHPAKTWLEFCDKLGDRNVANFDYHNNIIDNPREGGLGVVVHTGYGDGSYPVYARIDKGRVMEVKVVFDDTDEDSTEEDEDFQDGDNDEDNND